MHEIIKQSPLWRHLPALGGYLILSMLVLAPVLPHFGSAIPGGPVESGQRLEEQTVHGRPILAGYVSRQPKYPFAEEAPGVRQLWLPATERDTLLKETATTDLVALNYYGIDQVIVHWSEVESEQRAPLQQALASVLPGVRPMYTDDLLSAYSVPRVAAHPFAYFQGQIGTKRKKKARGTGAGCKTMAHSS